MNNLIIFYFISGAFTLSAIAILVYKTAMVFIKTKSETQKTTRKVHKLINQGRNPKEYFEHDHISMTDNERFAVYMATSGREILNNLKD